MRNGWILPIVAAAALMLAAGCGGGSGSSGAGANNSLVAENSSLGIVGGTGAATGAGGGNTVSAATIQGIWSGTASSSTGRASGAGNLEIDFSQSGTLLSGTAMLTQAPLFYSGAVTGTLSGSNAMVTVDYGSFGKAVYSLTIGGSSATGSYVLSAPNGGASIDSGTASLSKPAGITTPNITRAYVGSYRIGGSAPLALSLYISQNGDSITVSAVLNGTDTYSGTGTIIGNDLRFQATKQSGNGVIHAIGTVNGNTITGTIMEQGGGIGNNGDPIIFTFTVNAGLQA